MKRVAKSVYLPPELNERAAREAERRGLSANALIIVALEQLLDRTALPSTPPASAVVSEPPPAPPRDGVVDFD